MKYLIMLLLFGCSAASDMSSESYSIVYKVSGTGACIKASLTYSDQNEGTAQNSSATLPWTYTISTTDASQFLYISAQNNYSSGSITTSITINGVEKKKTTSTGAYVIATSSGSVNTLK